jgi:hypothetical protein
LTDKKKPTKQAVFALDPVGLKAMQEFQKSEDDMAKTEKIERDEKSQHLTFILDALRKDESKRQHRMAFEVEPDTARAAAGTIYRQKQGLTPDHLLKRIAGPQGDDLVNQILQARSNIMSSFGRPRTSRFAIGYELQDINTPDPDRSEEAVEAEQKKIEQMKELLWNCGKQGLEEDWSPNLSQFIKMITRDGLTFGRFAVEFIPEKDHATGVKGLHSFRAVDAGTIYRIMPSQKDDQTRRKQALQLLQQIQNKKFDETKYDNDEYKWVQVIGGRPIQVFTDKELVVYNLYPTTNVEFNGYPLTPIDQALNAISTHINITIHNKLYFEHGRAARGMLVFKSDDIDESTIQKIRLQFHQSINSVQNSWRMPVFAVGSEDDVSWQSIETSGRDKEFQFLSDDTARVILGAFQISPEELPGYSHLARGSNSQTLSESDNEYQLTAARDVGLRPLIYDVQDFFNTYVIPRFDEQLSKTHQLVLAGLEDDSPEKESTRIQQDMNVHMTYDDILEAVEKETLGPELGGSFPLNPGWQAAIGPYLTVGTIMENFFGVKDASKDPRYNYIRDEYWLQFQQILIQKAQMAMQNQMMVMQQSMPQQPGTGEAPPGEEPQDPNTSDEEKQQAEAEAAEKKEKWLEQNYQVLSKGISNNHNLLSNMILKRHTEIVEKNMEEWRKKSEQAVSKIMNATKGKKEE